MTDAPRIRVISGRPAALRAALADRVAELRSGDPLAPISVLVGASLQRPYLARWLAARLGGHANVQIFMPGDLGLALGAPALVASGRRALPPLADRVLLGQVARAHSGYFAEVADTPGFAEALFRLVRELRGAGYDLTQLGRLLDGATDAPNKAEALSEILADFEAHRSDFYGPDDALAVADPKRLEGLGLLVWGLLDPSPVLERLLGAVSERLPVDWYLPEVAGVANAPLGSLRKRLVTGGAVFEQTSPEPEPEVMALEIMRSRLFAAPSAPGIEADETLQLVSAPDPAREVRAAARACLAWAAEGVPFWRMAVAYRHSDAYRPLAEAVFAEARIPHYLHEGSSLAERPVGRQTRGLLALYDSDLSRQSVMDFLTDARLPGELHDEYEGVPAARWDSVSRQAGIVGGADQWAERLGLLEGELRESEPGDQPAWARERADDAHELGRFIADLDQRLRSHPERAPWADHLDYLDGLLGRYIVDAEEIMQALRGLERFTALESEVDFETFLEVVRRAVDTLRAEDVLGARAGAFARRGVNVLSVNSLPGIEFARIWILGATERAYPPPARQDPILLDGERAAVSERAGTPLGPSAARGSEEELLFALSCEAARERLVVSYARRATGESRPRLPSVFFREIASQLVGERVSAERAPLLSRPDVKRIPGDAIGAPVPGGRYAVDREIVSAAAKGAISPAERDRTYLQADVTRPAATATLELAAPSFERALAAHHARRSHAYSEWDGALGSAAGEAIAALVPPDWVFSPSVLEAYASCPQRFLMETVLKVRSVEEPERTVRLDPTRRGTLIHRIFERFHGEWKGEESASLARGADTRMREIAEEECAEAQARGETGYPAMWAADRLEIVEDCLRWLEIEREDPLTASLPLSACEARFGRRHFGERGGTLSQEEPLEIDLGERKLRLSGRIDRISWDRDPPTRFRVLDYKTGRVRDEEAAQLQGGRMLQLPLYVLAGARLLGVEPSAGEAAYVYPTRRGDFRTIAWDGEDLEKRRDEVNALLRAILDGIANGNFMLAPWSEDKACRFCALNPVCPTSRDAYVERKSADARMARFSEQIRSVP